MTLKQWSPAFLAPGTGNVEDNFSKDGGAGGWFGGDSAALDLRGCLKATCLLFKDSPSLDKQIPSEPATGLPGTISVSAFSMHQTAETATWGSMTE